MIKHVFLGFLNNVHETDAVRWYLRYHSKEVVRGTGPWIRRYETFKALPFPPQAKKWGAVNGFVTELWYYRVEDYLEAAPDYKPYTPPPGGWATAIGPVTMAPAVPTQDFLRKEPAPEEKHIIRWYRIFKYPEGVSVADGEKWYLETHSQETRMQPGLLKYVSYRALDPPPFRTPWCRIEELWYEDFDAWHKANIENPVKFTPPVWRKTEPFVDMMSSFVKYKPDYDFLKDNAIIP
ncbi:MAG: hypothetical protein PHE50_05785 [Dehalococcoidales bacterium]|nr:hypothetical protein [Dehalococcoidales bacterium]